jgi:hypothetical protein
MNLQRSGHIPLPHKLPEKLLIDFAIPGFFRPDQQPWTRSQRPDKKSSRQERDTPSITASGCMWRRPCSRGPSLQTGRSAGSSR